MCDKCKRYPRVLVVNGASLMHGTSMGLTMCHLFEGWPTDRIAQIYDDHNPPDPKICPLHWKLSLKDVPLDSFVRNLFGRNLNRVFGSPSQGLPPGVAATSTVGGRPPSRNRLRNISSAWADLLNYRLSRDFWAWIEKFQPEVIYSMLGSIRVMNLVLQISRKFEIPVVPHLMDDWSATHYLSSVWTRVPRRKLISRLNAVFRRSPLGMTIGDAMAEEYEERYGIRFKGFMNCVEIPPECPPPPERAEGDPLRFAFIGGMHYNRWRSLCEIGEALTELRAPAILEIYAPQRDIELYGSELRKRDSIRVRENVPTEALPAALLRSDIMVHVESFDEIARKYFRISLSTKVPFYMSTGRPILAYGPEEINTCRYLESCRTGIVVGKPDRALLCEAIRRLVADADARRNFGQRAWEQASQRHDARIVGEEFRELLAIAADSAKAG